MENALQRSEAQRQLTAVPAREPRIVSGTLRLERERLEIAPVVLARAESLRPAAEAKGVKLRTRIERDSLAVLADEKGLGQIVVSSPRVRR